MMKYDEYIERLTKIEDVIREARMAPPGDGEMIRHDIKCLARLVFDLERKTRYMDVEAP